MSDHPIDVAISHWAMIMEDGRPLTCGGDVAYSSKEAANGFNREMQVLRAAPMRRPELCPQDNHWHLRPPGDLDASPGRQHRNATLLRTLLAAPDGHVARVDLREAIDWGDVRNKLRGKHMTYWLSVLENYGLVCRDEDIVHVIDRDALTFLCHAIPERETT